MAILVFKLPDLGEGLPDAEIVEWYVNAGDQIAKDDLLVSVETAKAVVDVPSPYQGKVVQLHGKAGDIIDVGSPLAEFETEAAAGEEKEDAGTVVGKMETDSTVVKETTEALGKEVTEAKATPAVRALAKRLNVDLSVVKPSGPDGVVTADDVNRVAGILAELGPIEPLRGARRVMARTMSKAHEQVAAATLHDDADIHHWREGEDVTLRLIKAIVDACGVEPGLNAWYDNQSVGRRLLPTVDLGIAVDTEDGLFVPVLKDVGNLSDEQLRLQLERVKAGIIARDLPPEELRGASFTLSNFGTLGGRYATPVVVPPTVAILGTGAVVQDVVAENGAPVVHKVMPLSLTFDHRCVTGGEAARFLTAAIDNLQT